MIDVIIPSYNCSKTLGRTLSSLVAQTNTNFKVIIVDDNSKEDIKSIVDTYKDALDITYVRNNTNLGCGMSRQVGIDSSSSEYFTFLDSDDMFMPYTIEVFEYSINKSPDCDLFMSYFVRSYNSGDSAIYIDTQGFTWCHGKLYKREFFNKYGIRYKQKFSMWCDDAYLNFKCFELAKSMCIPVPMHVWTLNNPNSITKTRVDHKSDDKLWLESIIDACEFVLQYKDKLETLSLTLDTLSYDVTDDDEMALYNKLIEMRDKYGA
jgi:glycosyltransferase involved in cell wall biosynthesis